MKNRLMLFCLLPCLLLCPACAPQTSNIDQTVDMTPRLISSSTALSSTQIADSVKSAIVGISARLSSSTSIGSGVAIADGGYVLTNYHVISGAKSLTLYLANRATCSAQFLWGDSAVDIALLKAQQNLPYLDTAPLSTVLVGDDVLAVGTPLSLEFQHTFTKGIISALNRTIEIPSLGGYSTYMQNLIQHDASINSGNSGGPLINAQGRVIGINSLKASNAEGIGFAIPIETATAVTQKLIPNGSFQEVRLGVFALDASSARFVGKTNVEQGAFVEDIAPSSLLSKTPLKPGHVITKIGETDIKTTLDLRKAIYALTPGQTVTITYDDAGKTQTFVLSV